MAIGRRPEARQHDIFVAASEIRAGGSPFYRGLDRLLRENGIRRFAEVELPRYDGHLSIWANQEVCHGGKRTRAVSARVQGADRRACEGRA